MPAATTIDAPAMSRRRRDRDRVLAEPRLVPTIGVHPGGTVHPDQGGPVCRWHVVDGELRCHWRWTRHLERGRMGIT